MQNLVKQNEVKNIEKLERFYIRLSIKMQLLKILLAQINGTKVDTIIILH